MARLAAVSGLSPDAILSLDADMYSVFAKEIEEREKERIWGHTEELLATIIDHLRVLMTQLNRGIPVVQVAETLDMENPKPWPRPPWIETERAESEPEDDGVVVMSPRQLAQTYGQSKKKGGAG